MALVNERRATGATILDSDWYKTPDAKQRAREVRFRVKVSF